VMIEVPDPESRFRQVLGRWWLPWLQPQHLHFLPVNNLRMALAELGFSVVAVQRAEAHVPVDLRAAVVLSLHSALRCGEDVPWQSHPPSLAGRGVRAVGFAAALPLLVTAAVLDRVSAGILGGRGFSNAYRLVAKKD